MPIAIRLSAMVLGFLLLLLLIMYLSPSRQPDFSFIDDYLSRWNRFAGGENELVPGLKADKDRFLDELTFAVNTDSRKAMGRAVFYAVVQVGGFIPYESPLGKAIEKAVGSQVAIFSSSAGEKSYFAGDLYFWWEDHKRDYEPFPQYEQYVKSDFAQRTVIPMYIATVKKSDH